MKILDQPAHLRHHYGYVDNVNEHSISDCMFIIDTGEGLVQMNDAHQQKTEGPPRINP